MLFSVKSPPIYPMIAPSDKSIRSPYEVELTSVTPKAGLGLIKMSSGTAETFSFLCYSYSLRMMHDFSALQQNKNTLLKKYGLAENEWSVVQTWIFSRHQIRYEVHSMKKSIELEVLIEFSLSSNLPLIFHLHPESFWTNPRVSYFHILKNIPCKWVFQHGLFEACDFVLTHTLIKNVASAMDMTAIYESKTQCSINLLPSFITHAQRTMTILEYASSQTQWFCKKIPEVKYLCFFSLSGHVITEFSASNIVTIEINR